MASHACDPRGGVPKEQACQALREPGARAFSRDQGAVHKPKV